VVVLKRVTPQSGEDGISVNEKKRDWEGLARKLRAGKLLEQAAEEAGIPIEEAKTWLKDRRVEPEYDDDSLRLLSAKALVSGVHTLIAAAKEKDGRIRAEGGEFGDSYQYLDVDAAKALVTAGLKIRSMLGRGKTAGVVGKDLFDADEDTTWEFPTSD
jgi:hypothetical protein